METWMFVVTTVWGAIALVLYILECVIIVRKWNVLKSSFFKIYFASSVVNCLTYLNSLVTLRIPNQTGKNGSFAVVFEEKHFFGLEGFYMLMSHFAFVQYLMTTLFAVNRLTAVILPLRYEKVWRKLFSHAMLFVLTSPIVFTWPCLFFRASYHYQPNTDNYGTVTASNYVALNNQLSYTLSFLTLITTVINAATFILFLRHRSSTKLTEFELLVHNTIIFTTQLLAAIISTIANTQSYTSPIFVTMMALLPYCSDALTLLPPFVILLFKMVDLKQQLNAIDYFGVVAVWLCFFSIVFIISVTCILWCCVSKDDDQTVFAKFGMGPKHRTAQQKYAAQVEKAE